MNHGSVCLSPVHACGVSMQCCMPLDRKELHPTNDVLILGFLKVTLQQLQGHTTEIVH